MSTTTPDWTPGFARALVKASAHMTAFNLEECPKGLSVEPGHWTASGGNACAGCGKPAPRMVAPVRWLSSTRGDVSEYVTDGTASKVRAAAQALADRHGTPIRIHWGEPDMATCWVEPCQVGS